MDESLLKIYRMVELFDGLTPDELQAIVKISESVVYNEDDIIFAQGDVGDTMYIIRDGQVAVSMRKDDHSPAQTKIILGQGQIFGEIVLIDYGLRSATVQVVGDGAHLDVIRRDDFVRLCESRTLIGYIVMRNLAVDLAYKLRRQNLELPKE